MSRPTTTRLALVMALALAVCLSAIGIASATQTVQIDSTIKLRQSFPAFHGKVTSPNQACAENRLVKMFKKKGNGERKLLGKTHTGLNGKWQVIVDPLKSGAYLAVVKQREEGTAGTIFVCLRDKSKVAVVD